ncbi:MAG: hypothetical protein JW966_05150 [Anaerolineae bacterium]|nr:hypothetical protein [Anaerolineae bacterium]
MSRRDDDTISYFTGLIVGFIISAPVVAWLSPRSGSQTRAAIRQRGLVIRRQAESTVLKPLRQVQDQIDQLQARVEHIKGESIESALEEGKTIAAERAAGQPHAESQ